jgi:hypothetical protein
MEVRSMISMRISPARGLGTPLSLAIPGEDAPRAGAKGNLSLRWSLPARKLVKERSLAVRDINPR